MTIATRGSREVRAAVDQAHGQVAADARAHVARARRESRDAMNAIGVAALQDVHQAAKEGLHLANQVRQAAAEQVAVARQLVPRHLADVQARAAASLADARANSRVSLNTVIDRASAGARHARRQADTHMAALGERATATLERARAGAEGLIREISGQGPDKTLGRGFAIVRDDAGKPVTSLAQASSDHRVESVRASATTTTVSICRKNTITP